MDLASLQKSVEALERSLKVSQSNREASAELRETIRAGVIQHFEIADEQCWKFVQRWLRENSADPQDAVFPRTRKDLFRMAARLKLISNPEAWFEYGDARNLTSHAYEEEYASIVFEIAPRFLDDSRELLKTLAERND